MDKLMKFFHINNEESLVNLIMFLFYMTIPVCALVFVIILIGGNFQQDGIVLLMLPSAILVRLLEKKLKGYAKYFYSAIMPILGAVTIAYGHDGRFVCMLEAYFLVTAMTIAYNDSSVVLVNGAFTIFANLIGIIFFTDAFLVQDIWVAWLFNVILYSVMLFICVIMTEQIKLIRKKNQDIIHTLASEYTDVYLVNLSSHIFEIIRKTGVLYKKFTSEKGNGFDYDYEIENFIQNNVHKDDQERLLEQVKLTYIVNELKNVPSYINTFRVITSEGIRYYAMKISQHTEATIIVAFGDVTKQIEAEQKQKEMLEEALLNAKQANKAKTIFLSNMSHDIRTPMNAIIGFSGIAVNSIDDKEKVKDCLDKIQYASGHLLNLINDVLDMSRIESGKVALQEEEENLSELIHSVVNIMRPQMQDRNIFFTVDTFEITNEMIIVDAIKLNRILINILGNALKFTPSGNSVSFNIRQKKDAPEGFACFEFRIKDTGKGMSEEFVQRIFEPFEREIDTTNSRVEGTGLGMAITKNIVDMMGGVISVNSKLAEGTEFIIDLPLRLSRMEENTISDVFLQDLRVLVIDDELESIENIVFLLDQLKIRTDWTTSTQEALLRAKQAIEKNDPFQIFIVDMLMPNIDGIETTKKIREKFGNEVPIILLSAYDWVDVEETAKAAGVSSFCSKPLFKSDLFRVLRKSNIVNTAIPKEETKDTGITDLSNKHILIVEDTPLNQQLMIYLLKQRNAKISLANNGVEAVDLFTNSSEGTFDLIFMDIMMPKKNGLETTQEIRAMDRADAKSIPIIAMTANAFEDDKRNSMEAGMNAHISKPFKPEALDVLLRKYLSL